MNRTVVFLLFPAALALAQWEPDRRLTVDTSSSFTSANNAWSVAAKGDVVHVVWNDYRVDGGIHSELFYKRSTDGGASWSPDLRLTTDSAHSFDPCIAVSGSYVHVVRWTSDVAVCYKRSANEGLTWSEDIFQQPSSDNCYPSIAASGEYVHAVWGNRVSASSGVSPEENACAVWGNRRDTYWQVYYKNSLDGGVTWGPVTCLTDDTAGSNGACVAATGYNVYVAWFDRRDGNDEIYLKRSVDGGSSWLPDVRLTNNPAQSVAPCVGASGPYVHVVWADYQLSLPLIFYARSTNWGVSWSTPTMIGGQLGASLPSIAVSGSNLHVVWQDMRDLNLEIYYKRSADAGVTWGPDTRLTTDTAWSWLSSVAASDSKVHVAWADERDGNSEIYYKRNPTGNSPGIAEDGGWHDVVFEAPKASVARNVFRLDGTDPAVLLDVSGRVVIGLEPGLNDIHALAPGVYFCRLHAGGETRARKLIVQR